MISLPAGTTQVPAVLFFEQATEDEAHETSNPSSTLALVLGSNSETEVSMSNGKTARIRKLNDALRQGKGEGQVVMTDSVRSLPDQDVAAIMNKLIGFDDFDKGNDPYGEHDFGAVEHNGQRFFFKIDYYDKKMQYGSEDPSDPAQTSRVMTIMLAEEY